MEAYIRSLEFLKNREKLSLIASTYYTINWAIGGGYKVLLKMIILLTIFYFINILMVLYAFGKKVQHFRYSKS